MTRCCRQPYPQPSTWTCWMRGGSKASLPVRWGELGVRSAVMLAPSAYLASAASTVTLVLKLLPSFLHPIADRSTPNILAAWQSAVAPATLAPVDMAATRQRAWDDPFCQRSSSLLLCSAVDDSERARLPRQPHCLVRRLAAGSPDFIRGPADGRRRHQGGGGSASRR